MVISQGDIFWVDFPDQDDSGPAFTRPAIVIQCNALNQSRLATTVVCPLTTHMELGSALGNVKFAKGEAGLPRACIANVSQIYSVDKKLLRQKIGKISDEQTQELFEGVVLALQPEY